MTLDSTIQGIRSHLFSQILYYACLCGCGLELVHASLAKKKKILIIVKLTECISGRSVWCLGEEVSGGQVTAGREEEEGLTCGRGGMVDGR